MRNKVETMIKEFVKHYAESKGFETKWKEPLIAYADAEDKMFYELKEVVSHSHALPKDFLQEAKTVITYFIPFDDTVIRSNIDGKECSRVWAIAYIETNQLIADLRLLINIFCQQPFKF